MNNDRGIIIVGAGSRDGLGVAVCCALIEAGHRVAMAEDVAPVPPMVFQLKLRDAISPPEVFQLQAEPTKNQPWYQRHSGKRGRSPRY